MLYLSNLLLCRLCTVAVDASRDVSLEAGPAKAILYDILIGVACVAKHRAASPQHIRTDKSVLGGSSRLWVVVCSIICGINVKTFRPGPRNCLFGVSKRPLPASKTNGKVVGEAPHLFRWLLERGGAVWIPKVDDFRPAPARISK